MAEQGVLRVAMGQIRLESGAPQRNLAEACTAIDEAARESADVIVLPECGDWGWMDARPDEVTVAHQHRFLDGLAEAARRNGTAVVAGYTEVTATGLHNAAVAFDSTGSVCAHHRKINVLDIAADLYVSGRDPTVAVIDGVRVGVLICADLFPDRFELGQRVAVEGAGIILAPSAWAVPPDHDNAREPYGEMWLRSFATIGSSLGLGVVAVSGVGRIAHGAWAGYPLIGNSIATDPSGAVLAIAPFNQPSVTIVDVPLATGTTR